MSAPTDQNSLKIQVIKLKNILKDRLGSAFQGQEEGFIAPEVIEEADKYIQSLCVDCPGTLDKHLTTLTALWGKMKEMPVTPERAELSRQVFTLAHEIKDVGSMCNYALISHFAESLRDYIGHAELNIQAQVVIIQAHLDAMLVAHRQGFKEDGGPEAEELKRMVKKAIEKYQ